MLQLGRSCWKVSLCSSLQATPGQLGTLTFGLCWCRAGGEACGGREDWPHAKGILAAAAAGLERIRDQGLFKSNSGKKKKRWGDLLELGFEKTL